jgi:hypothetical protein
MADQLVNIEYAYNSLNSSRAAGARTRTHTQITYQTRSPDENYSVWSAKLLLVLAITVILGSMARGTFDHIFTVTVNCSYIFACVFV